MPLCPATAADHPLDLTAWENEIERLAADGQRVLAVAVKPVSKDGPLDEASIAEGLVLLGLVGLIDPPRPEAVTAIARCREAGIRTKMITGDHAVTARAIAREIGLTDRDEVITGQELATIDDTDLPERRRSDAHLRPGERPSRSCGSSRRCRAGARSSP